MKKIIIVLAAILFSFQSFAQSSKLFEDVEVARFRGGISSEPVCIIYATLVTDILSGDRDGFVTIKTRNNTILYRNDIDRDEIESAISALEYAMSNLVMTKPKDDTRVLFVSSTDCLIGLRYLTTDIIRNWTPFVQTNSLNNESLVSLKTSDLDGIIKALKESVNKIDSFVSGS